MDYAPIKKLCFCLFLVIFISSYANSQFATEVIITDLPSYAPAKIMEENASQLLTSFNWAYKDGETTELFQESLSPAAKSSILALWETSSELS